MNINETIDLHDRLEIRKNWIDQLELVYEDMLSCGNMLHAEHVSYILIDLKEDAHET